MSFSKHIEYIGRKVGRHRAFDDFLTFCVCSLSLFQKEELYLKTAKSYDKEEMQNFSQAFAELVHEMDNKGAGLKDCLGDYFMEYANNKHKGQFFTPEDICDLMAQCLGMDKEKEAHDPCCGSGRIFLSIAKLNRNVIFYGADVDYRCCQMTLINMCLNGLKGSISHMNSLSLEEWHRWEVNIHPIFRVPYIYEIDLSAIKKEEKPKIEEKEKETIIKPTQMQLLFEEIDSLLM